MLRAQPRIVAEPGVLNVLGPAQLGTYLRIDKVIAQS